MTRKDVIILAEMLRIHNRTANGRTEFTPDHLRLLADFCTAQYPTFNRELWIDYIAGENSHEDRPKSGRSGPRLTANKQRQKVLMSLLRQLRRDAGLRQVDMAKALGKPQAFVSYYESGARRLDLMELRKVCEVLGVSLGAFTRQFEKELRHPIYEHVQRQPVSLKD